MTIRTGLPSRDKPARGMRWSYDIRDDLFYEVPASLKRAAEAAYARWVESCGKPANAVMSYNEGDRSLAAAARAAALAERSYIDSHR